MTTKCLSSSLFSHPFHPEATVSSPRNVFPHFGARLHQAAAPLLLHIHPVTRNLCKGGRHAEQPGTPLAFRVSKWLLAVDDRRLPPSSRPFNRRVRSSLRAVTKVKLLHLQLSRSKRCSVELENLAKGKPFPLRHIF